MPANIMLPTKAKMAALVCSGRSRPNEVHGRPRLACQNGSWVAIRTPTRSATTPNTSDASVNAFTIQSS